MYRGSIDALTSCIVIQIMCKIHDASVEAVNRYTTFREHNIKLYQYGALFMLFQTSEAKQEGEKLP